MAALPFAPVTAVISAGPVLVLAPHPDDESLGCGGMIAQACAACAEVHVAILTDGTQSHPRSSAYPAPRLKALREQEAAEAVAVLGVPPGRLTFLGYPDAAAPRRGPALSQAATRFAAFTRERDIRTVCATWRYDPHADHLAAHRIASAGASLGGYRLLSYPVWGWMLGGSTWLPRMKVAGFRLDITGVLPAKRRAIACHRSQMTDLVADDDTFRVPAGLLEACERPFEVFLSETSVRG
jgi:LmbE family N-acetylglucosaminyl deacetylase